MSDELHVASADHLSDEEWELHELAMAVALMLRRGPRALDEPIANYAQTLTETFRGTTVRVIRAFDMIESRMKYRFDYKPADEPQIGSGTE